jgi:hypothetical protein
MFDRPPYSMSQTEKECFLLDALNSLTEHHRRSCSEYGRIVDIMHPEFVRASRLEEIPWLPVGLFQSHRLVSVPAHEIIRTLTSSGTTGQSVSQVALDRQTAADQTRALGHIMGEVLGKKRLPMIVLDTKALLSDRKRLSARAAGVLGMMNLGRAHFWALNEDFRLDTTGLREFLARYGNEPFLLFGFTFMVWQYLLKQIGADTFDLCNGILVHSGGWKKLQEEAVSNAQLCRQAEELTGLSRIHNFYGMVEQVGSVFLEGHDGLMHAPFYADVIVRSPRDWSPAPNGEPGVLQVLSALPRSYPGHSLLTEDMGVIHDIDPPGCPWGGKAFEVIGRVPKAELRGCSDVHAFAVGDAT